MMVKRDEKKREEEAEDVLLLVAALGRKGKGAGGNDWLGGGEVM